jgi:hypothetical protein
MLHFFNLAPCQPGTPLARKGIKVVAPRMEAGGTGSHGAFFKEASMSTCPKCAGLLVPVSSPLHLLSDYFIDTYDLQDPLGEAVQCLNCGLYSDTVTIANKAKQADAQRLVEQAQNWADHHSVIISTMEGYHHASTEKRRETFFDQDAA